jgi:SulP family sulfate permease
VVLCLVTGVTVVANLAVAVAAGVVLASLGFAWKSAQRISASRAVETGPGKAVQVDRMKLQPTDISNLNTPFYPPPFPLNR